MKRITLSLVLFFCSSIVLAESPNKTIVETKPNVLVFLVDDMGVMDTSVPFLSDAEGQPETHPLNEFYRTPNMKRLADQGIRFSNFYANSVCSPSRVSILTGQTSARHWTTQYIKPESNNRGDFGPLEWKWKGLGPADVTLPRILQGAGYRTIHCGKAHFGPIGAPGADPLNLGFDINIAGRSIGAPGSYYGTDNFDRKKRGPAKGKEKRKGKGKARAATDRSVPGLEKYHGQDIHLTEALTLEMKAAMSQAVTDKKPFFAYMSHYAVHAPFQSDKRFTKNYEGEKKQKLAFATMIEGMDKSLGDLLEHLNTLGVAEDTLVLFLGDNGTDAPLGPTHTIACAAPLRGKKGTHYEGGMRVPFIAAWGKPDGTLAHQQKLAIPANRLYERVGTVYDLMPTILSVANVPAPKDHVADGRDLSLNLTGKSADSQDDSFLMHFPHDHRSDYFTVLRLGHWKLVYHYNPQPGTEVKTELFDLESDPFEEHNLSEKNPGKLTQMISEMSERLEKSNAQYPLKADQKTEVRPLVPVGS